MSATGAAPLRHIAVRNGDSSSGAVRRPLNFIDDAHELLSDFPERGSAPEDCPQGPPGGTNKFGSLLHTLTVLGKDSRSPTSARCSQIPLLLDCRATARMIPAAGQPIRVSAILITKKAVVALVLRAMRKLRLVWRAAELSTTMLTVAGTHGYTFEVAQRFLLQSDARAAAGIGF